MKKLKILTAALLCLLILTACAPAQSKTGEKLAVTATVFPVYDWVKNIAGDKVELKLLINGGVDLHSFNPSAADMVGISKSDLFIYIGGESDEWVEDALKGAANPDRKALALLPALGELAMHEQELEGMEHEHEHEHDEDEEEYDEHIWLSFRNARVLCGAICDALCEKDGANAGFYRSNLESYLKSVAELEAEYQSAIKDASRRALVIADRFPFGYLSRELGLECYAAFKGCSAETEASFDTIVFLAKKINELSVPAIIQTETAQGAVARAVLDTAGVTLPVLTLDSMQSVTVNGNDKDESYLGILRRDLDILKQALK